MAPFERAMAVSYRLSIVTVALSVTIWPQFAIECLRRSNQHGVGHFGPKFPDVTNVTISQIRQVVPFLVCDSMQSMLYAIVRLSVRPSVYRSIKYG